MAPIAAGGLPPQRRTSLGLCPPASSFVLLGGTTLVARVLMLTRSHRSVVEADLTNLEGLTAKTE